MTSVCLDGEYEKVAIDKVATWVGRAADVGLAAKQASAAKEHRELTDNATMAVLTDTTVNCAATVVAVGTVIVEVECSPSVGCHIVSSAGNFHPNR